MICFTFGGAVPLLAGSFLQQPEARLLVHAYLLQQRVSEPDTCPQIRLGSVLAASTAALILFGAIGAYLGGAHKVRAALPPVLVLLCTTEKCVRCAATRFVESSRRRLAGHGRDLWRRAPLRRGRRLARCRSACGFQHSWPLLGHACTC